MVSEELLSRVRKGMQGLKPPGHYDKVYKEECMFSFETPESSGGLYVNLKTYQGFGADYVKLDHERTGQTLYLHENWKRVPLKTAPPAAEGEAEAEANKPTKLAIGTEGGFALNKKSYDLDKTSELVLLPDHLAIPLPCPELPELVLNVINAIAAHESVNVQDQAAAWEEERRVSKYAVDLVQLESTRKISPNPKDWACDETGVKENLWLNLSTGHIGSGRKNWDGSGGNGSALRHFEATGGRYPLVVKLGTITPSGADVYSYAPDEDDMVTDPKLAEHLAHWGINMMQMEKTEKTMAELQIDLNIRHEFDAITESGAALLPLTGPGHVGLINLGNSCYMNSVVQVLFTLPEVQSRYVGLAPTIFNSSPQDPAGDLPVQMAKLGVALVQGVTGAPTPAAAAAGNGSAPMDTEGPTADEAAAAVAAGVATAAAAGGGSSSGVKGSSSSSSIVEGNAVRPLSFKTLVGKGHQEFSSMRQQDAAEFMGYLLEKLARAEHAEGARLGGDEQPSTNSIFTFSLEDRTQCLTTHHVSYSRSNTTSLALHIPLEAATNAEAVAEYKEREAKRQRLKEEEATAYIGAEVSGTAGGSEVLMSEAEAPVLPLVPFSACLARFSGDEELEDYFSAAAGRKVAASRRSRVATFPPYLVVQLKRYYVASDWTPKKLEVEVPMPEEIDLEHLRGHGPQPGEQLQPEEPAVAAAGAAGGAAAAGGGGAGAAGAAAAVVADETVVMTLVSMGFSENAGKRAAIATGNTGAESAMEWVLGHLEDPDINDPPPEPAAAAAAGGGGGGGGPDPEQVSMLTAMGFSAEAATAALKSCSNNVERAADWLFSHMDDLEAAVAAVNQEGTAAAAAGGAAAAAGGAAAGGAGAGAAGGNGAAKLLDGPGRYRLLGIISHMGSNTACGHYVAHIRKEGRWVIFNDEKVAASEHPPLSLGYMYVYQRVQQ